MNANSKQVGGSHYAGKYQHWDLVIEYRIPYLEAVATKYIERHPKKDGRKDLEKSLHYVEKLLEAIRNGRAKATRYFVDDEEFELRLASYFEQRPHMGEAEKVVFRQIISWREINHLLSAEAIVRRLIDLRYPQEGL